MRLSAVQVSKKDEGSILPLALLCVLIALLLIAGTSATSAAFLAQRDLQAWCDAAALAAAGSPGDSTLYAGVAPEEGSPIAVSNGRSGLDHYLAEVPADQTLVRLDVQVDRVTVVCTRTVELPFGRLFGISGGLRREAVSAARVRWSA